MVRYVVNQMEIQVKESAVDINAFSRNLYCIQVVGWNLGFEYVIFASIFCSIYKY